MRFPYVYSIITSFTWVEFSFVNEKRKSGMELYPSFLVKWDPLPLPNHVYFETDFKVFKMCFQYLNTILLYFNPV